MSLAAARRWVECTGAAGWRRPVVTLFLLLAATLASAARSSLDPRDLVGHGGPVKAIAISRDGARAITGSFDYSMIAWRFDAAKPRLEHRFLDHEAAVNAVAFADHGRRAVTGSDDATVGVFDLDAGRLIARLKGHAMKVVGVAVSPDGRWAASASWDMTARLWDLKTLKAGPVLSGHAGNVNAVAFTADSAHLLTAGYDGTLREWRVADGVQERIVEKHGWGINVIKLMGDGTHVLFGALDGTLGLVDLAGVEEARVIARRQRPILALALSLNGALAAAGGDGLIEVYDTTIWKVVRSLDNPYGPVWALAFTASGDALYMGGLDDEAHFWQFLPGNAFEQVVGDYPRRFQVSEGVGPGELQFRRKCSICHTLKRDGGNRAGPSLYGIFGRRAGTLPGYVYSPALAHSAIVWNEETIGRLFAESPEHYIPGTKMPLQKMANADDRAALIAYLRRATGPTGPRP